MKKKSNALIIGAALLGGGVAHAQSLTLEITNLTQGIYFTPRLAVTHNSAVDIFQTGEAASTPLTQLAEGGATQPFIDYLNDPSREANNSATSFGGLLAPATTAAYQSMQVGSNETHLSLAAMMLPTNDGFVGLDSWPIPSEPGTYVVYLNAYDAGSESNDEIAGNRPNITEAGSGDPIGGADVPGFPTPPPTVPSLGTNGTGVTIQIDASNQLADSSEGRVHIHPGNLGDTDPNGGVSDIDSRVHRWLNPVARLKVVVAN